MAVLPDLDTTNIGVIAYWNASNHGVSSIDPREILDYNDVYTYQQYDNGIDGTLRKERYNEGSGENVLNYGNDTNEAGPETIYLNFRIKSDGWILVWTDRTNEFGIDWFSNNTLEYTGYYDILDDWSHIARANGNNYVILEDNEPEMLPISSLSNKIQDLQNKLSNSGSITFTHSDVGYYCYEYPNANRMSVVTEYYGNNGDVSYPDMDGGLSYTSGVTRYYHAAIGVNASDYDYQTRPSVDLYFNGQKLCSSRITRRVMNYGVVDVLASGLMPNPDQTYYNNDMNGSADSSNAIHHLLIYQV